MSRRRITAPPTSDDVFPAPVPPTQRPLDPAYIAAQLMLERAAGRAVGRLQHLGDDGVVVLVTVPNPSWTIVLVDAWRALFRRGGVVRMAAHRSSYHNEQAFTAFAFREPPNPLMGEDELKVFAEAVSSGQHCLIVTPDLEWLAPAIPVVSDHRLDLAPLTRADVLAIAARLGFGESTDVLGDDLAARLLPDHLRLACRVGQTASEFLRRLRTLLDIEARSTKPNEPLPSKNLREAPSLNRLDGMDEAVQWGLRLQRDLHAFKAGQLNWHDVDRGCLLSGPPGSGKTLFARALATSCKVPLIVGSYGEWLAVGSGHLGNLLISMRRAFAEARKSTPSIIFIDEVDSFPDRSRLDRDAQWHTEVVNALLTEIDGVSDRTGVVVIGATNHPHRVDPALRRSGRLDRHIRVDLPDVPALTRIMREHLGDDLAEEDLSSVALRMFVQGATGADVERAVRGARRRAREVKRAVILDDINAELSGDPVDVEHLWRAAVHEAGHAVLTMLLRPGVLRRVVLGTSGSMIGVTAASRQPLWQPHDIRCQLIILLGGRAAEELLFDEPSSGSGGGQDSDLAQATMIATSSAATMGFDHSVGLTWLGQPDVQSMHVMLASCPALAASVRRMLDEAYAGALELLRRKPVTLHALASALRDRRILDPEEVTSIIAAVIEEGPA